MIIEVVCYHSSKMQTADWAKHNLVESCDIKIPQPKRYVGNLPIEVFLKSNRGFSMVVMSFQKPSTSPDRRTSWANAEMM